MVDASDIDLINSSNEPFGGKVDFWRINPVDFVMEVMVMDRIYRSSMEWSLDTEI